MMAGGTIRRSEMDLIVAKAVEMGLPASLVNKMVVAYIGQLKTLALKRAAQRAAQRAQAKESSVDFGSLIDDFLRSRPGGSVRD